METDHQGCLTTRSFRSQIGYRVAVAQGVAALGKGPNLKTLPPATENRSSKETMPWGALVPPWGISKGRCMETQLTFLPGLYSSPGCGLST